MEHMADDQLRIRLLAYRLWEAEDCPEGQAERHWNMACRLVAAERITDVPQDAQPRPTARSKKPVEPVADAADGEAASDTTAEPAAKKAPARRASTTKRRSTASSTDDKVTTSKAAAGKTATGARKTTATKKKTAAGKETTASRKNSDSSNDDKSDQ
ncbi:hypothetical protein GCM10010082_24140 [Kushneria pakistanensis]|uniref:DUF2934 domain-containing protein n=2 Tax=Kushneria pakistanensis TaxID=1508770 RepID=A0ABQ3FLQ8_9GAMM|nr:hypothetical protein GCM10010082_24140 [Kushneria pakistanensis]